MPNVVHLKIGAAGELRAIAEKIDKGECADCITVVAGSEIYHCAPDDKPLEDSARDVVFDCSFAIAKIFSMLEKDKEFSRVNNPDFE